MQKIPIWHESLLNENVSQEIPVKKVFNFFCYVSDICRYFSFYSVGNV